MQTIAPLHKDPLTPDPSPHRGEGRARDYTNVALILKDPFGETWCPPKWVQTKGKPLKVKKVTYFIRLRKGGPA